MESLFQISAQKGDHEILYIKHDNTHGGCARLCFGVNKSNVKMEARESLYLYAYFRCVNVYNMIVVAVEVISLLKTTKYTI